MICIVRHGQTALNVARVLQGRRDEPLNETGIRQAETVGELFRRRGIRFDAVYSSPLRRALTTARLIAGETAPISTDERLFEIDYGPYEGMSLTDPAPEIMAFFRDLIHTPAPAGVEPLDSVVARMGAFLEEHKTEAAEKTILIATHAVAMKGALEYLTPASRGSYWGKAVGNCAVYVAEVTDGAYTVPVEFAPEEENK